MARMTAGVCVLALMAAVADQDARAEERSNGWDGRVFLSVGGGYQPASGGFDYRDTQTFFQEEASAQARFAPKGAPALEVGGGVRLGGRFGIGATLSAIRKHQPTTLTVVVPHPLFFNRSVTGSAAASSSHDELALHLQGIFLMPLGRRLRLGLSGGPSYFWLQQQLVTDADLEPTLLPDLSFTLAVPALHTRTVSQSAWGFHAGAELTVQAAKHVGFSGLVRYSRATASVENALAGTRTGTSREGVSVRMGGLSAIGGLKLWF